MRSELFYFFKVIFTPACWAQNSTYASYSKEWDDKLRRLLVTDKFIIENRYTAKIGGIRVWIENHPYASFERYHGVKLRPSRRTKLMAFDKLAADSLSEVKNG